MIKLSNFFIVVIALCPSLPMIGMESQLRKTILVREARKAESKRKEHIGQAFTTCLNDTYKTAIGEGLRLHEICNLTKEAKALLETTLKIDIKQLLDQISAQACIMRSLIGTTNFNQIIGNFNMTAVQHLVHAFNCADISPAESEFYALQHSRNATNARVQATNKIITLYSASPKKETEEDNNFGNDENENINE